MRSERPTPWTRIPRERAASAGNAHIYRIRQFRRHDRAVIHAQKRRVYKARSAEGKLTTVAANRNKAVTAVPKTRGGEPVYDENGFPVVMGKAQEEDSLHEFRMAAEKKYGKVEARKIISRLYVVKSTRSCNRRGRLMTGAICLYQGDLIAIEGQQNNGRYFISNGRLIPAADVRVLKKIPGWFICPD